MRSTLFYIPHELAGIPLLGFGWLLLFLFVGMLSWMAWYWRRGQLSDELSAGLPVWLIAAAVVVFVLPQIESRWPDGSPIGLPVRGYGVMVLLGLFSGIGITVWRGQQVGVLPDTIVSLGFWMMLGGVLGARIFFVMQYWNEFAQIPMPSRLMAIVKLTEGGLVIYGGMIGGALAGLFYCWRYRLPTLAFADLITPGFLIGLSFGRIGCLLNGCCFGGVCEAPLPTVQFPQGSPPYVAQLENGRLFGVRLQAKGGHEAAVVEVAPGSLAEKQFAAEPGMAFSEQHQSVPPEPRLDDPARTPAMIARVAIGPKETMLTPEQLPAWSLPVHPSQIYSSIDALLLCVLILCLQPWVHRDGQAFMFGVLLHGIARFTLELIRSDEMGQFGTSLTIAQWISIVGIVSAAAGLIITSRLPAKRAWRWQV